MRTRSPPGNVEKIITDGNGSAQYAAIARPPPLIAASLRT
jgi:hypothetical protein